MSQSQNATTYADSPRTRHHLRTPTIPFARTTRQKPRRWPLVLRFIKGAIHGAIIVPVIAHGLFAALVVFLDRHMNWRLGLPDSIVRDFISEQGGQSLTSILQIPSISIVVGLMLVFRNQTSYNRFWDGRNYLGVIITSVRNLTRSFLACSLPSTSTENGLSSADHAETERVVHILIAILYATKNHLRAEWGAEIIPGTTISKSTGNSTMISEYSDLLPYGLTALDDKGVGLPLQLTFFVEQYIKRFFDKGAFHGPQASQMQVQLNLLTDAYGKMETIRLTSIPVALLIHQKQVLGLFGCILPFALVEIMFWWAVPIVILIMFTLYGIDGIGSQLEDPFGYDRNDIKMDAIVEDIRSEILVLLDEWKRVGYKGREMFMSKPTAPQRGGSLETR